MPTDSEERQKFVVNASKFNLSELSLLERLAPVLDIEVSKVNGVLLEASKIPEKGLKVFYDADNVQINIEYSDMHALARSFTHFREAYSSGNVIAEQAKFTDLAFMLDVSRNAVLSVDSVKILLNYLASMGYNALLLYMEDIYQVDDYPYFSYQRGGYTPQELREIDNYAYSVGIEVIPCIQTLAHLQSTLVWPYAKDFRDTEDILLVGEEKTYKFIRSLLEVLSANLRSRRIHLGMDEAFGLGRGQSIDKYGYEPAYKLFARHLHRVKAICAEFGYRPMIWSDMYEKFDLHKKLADGAAANGAYAAANLEDSDISNKDGNASSDSQTTVNGKTPVTAADSSNGQDKTTKNVQVGQNPQNAGNSGFAANPPESGESQSQQKLNPDSIVPNGVDLVYWDYYNIDKNIYLQHFNNIQQANNDSEAWFAGGIWTWNGLKVNHGRMFRTSEAGLSAAVQSGVKHVMATAWGDDGAETSVFEGLLDMQYFAEFDWQIEEPDVAETIRRFNLTTGNDGEAYYNMRLFDEVPGVEKDNLDSVNPSKYILYSDVLTGLFDAHIIPMGNELSEHYSKLAEYYDKKADESGNQIRLFYLQSAQLADVLQRKVVLTMDLRNAYLSGDRFTLEQIVEYDLPELIAAVTDLQAFTMSIWYLYNKPQGSEIIDSRFGAQLARLNTCLDRVDGYIKGVYEYLPELESKRLPFDGRSLTEVNKNPHISVNNWKRLISANIL